MQVSEFNYELPDELIAQRPSAARTDSRLLALHGATGQVRDLQFIDLRSLLRPGDLLIMNDTRVIRARLFGRKQTGGRIELLIERILDAQRVLAQIRASKTPRVGQILELEGQGQSVAVTVERRQEPFFVVSFPDTAPVLRTLERIGHVPLPPYIRRADDTLDGERYQTVYASIPGAVAAPTAGLHFDRALLGDLRNRGVETAFLTLHVGAGTFQPLRVRDVRDHAMHPEWLSVPEQTCEQIATARVRGGRVVAVGTTVVRALETAAQGRTLAAFQGDSRLFIYPGHRFRVVDAMITNFHLPGSTLLMLVCAFAGTRHTLAAYRHAVAKRYRFYSYGDAMFVTPHPSSHGKIQT